MPRGIPKSAEAHYSENTRALIEHIRELEARLRVERAKERARTLLLQFAQKHQLTAADLRTAAKVLADRQVAGAPVQTLNSKHKASGAPGQIKTHMLKPPKGKVGKAIRAARIKLNLSDKAVGDAIGCSSSLVGKWQSDVERVPGRFHEKLTKVLKLPKGIFPVVNGTGAP